MTAAGDGYAMSDDDCHAAVRDLQTFLDGECAESLERVITAHLRECAPCVHRADFERELRVVLATRCRDAAPAHLVERVIVTLTQRG
jgi:anti-sigma factor (TIGR02949 family)